VQDRDESTTLPNAYPMIEVFLFLILALIGGAAGATKTQKVELPGSPSPEQPVPRPVVVTVTRDGAYYLGQQAFAMDELVGRLTRQAAQTPILIKADVKAEVGPVLALIGALKAKKREPVVAVQKEE